MGTESHKGRIYIHDERIAILEQPRGRECPGAVRRIGKALARLRRHGSRKEVAVPEDVAQMPAATGAADLGTEGHELHVLQSVDWSKTDVRAITVQEGEAVRLIMLTVSTDADLMLPCWCWRQV